MSQTEENEFGLPELSDPSYEDLEEQNRMLKDALRPFAEACEALGLRQGEDGSFHWENLDVRQDPDGSFHWTGPAHPGFGPADLARASAAFRARNGEPRR